MQSIQTIFTWNCEAYFHFLYYVDFFWSKTQHPPSHTELQWFWLGTVFTKQINGNVHNESKLECCPVMFMTNKGKDNFTFVCLSKILSWNNWRYKERKASFSKRCIFKLMLIWIFALKKKRKKKAVFKCREWVYLTDDDK